MMAKKKQPTNKVKKKCPQCKVPMQERSRIVKGFVTRIVEECTRCGQTDVREVTDEIKD